MYKGKLLLINKIYQFEAENLENTISNIKEY